MKRRFGVINRFGQKTDIISVCEHADMDSGMPTAIPFTVHITNIVLQCLLLSNGTIYWYGDSASTWRTPEVVLNHSVGYITDKTVWHIALAENNRDRCSVESVKCLSKVNEGDEGDAAMFVTLQVSITHLCHHLFSG